MNNLLLKKNQLLYKITSFILILSSLSTLPVSALESPDHNISNIQEDFTDVSSDTDTNDELKQQFQPLIENIFLKFLVVFALVFAFIILIYGVVGNELSKGLFKEKR